MAQTRKPLALLASAMLALLITLGAIQRIGAETSSPSSAVATTYSIAEKSGEPAWIRGFNGGGGAHRQFENLSQSGNPADDRSRIHYVNAPLPTALASSVDTNSVMNSATYRISVASDGTQGNDDSSEPSVSADGRYVAFESDADNLVPGDTNNRSDVFLHDRQTGQTARISVASDGTQADNFSSDPVISADGRYIAFTSFAALLPGDGLGADIFLHDRLTGELSIASVTSDGAPANDGAWGPSISAGGRYVAFYSSANNLAADDTNTCPNYTNPGSCPDVFVHDRQTGLTERVSVASNGTQGNNISWAPSISADGNFVAFWSDASNLVPNDTNNMDDIFVHDRQTGQTELVSVASDGTQVNDFTSEPSISGDGRYVTFSSDANNLAPSDTNNTRDVLVHDRQTGHTSRISVASNGAQGNNGSKGGQISADGRYVAFTSFASNLVPNDRNNATDTFVHDLHTAETIRVSVASDGTQGNGHSEQWQPSISTDGRYIAFSSSASNLVSGDTNSLDDVFVHDRGGSDVVCTVPFYWQRDGRWNTHPLRTAGVCSTFCGTIGKCGCTLTSSAMLFSLYGNVMTPPQLSDCMGTSACPFHWNTGCRGVGITWVGSFPFNYDTLSTQLNQQQRPVIVGMHRAGNPNDTHWVLVTAGQGNSADDYTMHDPWLENGANPSLGLREDWGYVFDRISVYAGPTSCDQLAVRASRPSIKPRPAIQTTALQENSIVNGEHAATMISSPASVVGDAWLYHATAITMTVHVTATSTAGTVTEMQVWNADNPEPEWQPFTPLVWLTWSPGGEEIFARFRDDQGNISEMVSDSPFPQYSPPPEVWTPTWLPIIRR